MHESRFARAIIVLSAVILVSGACKRGKPPAPETQSAVVVPAESQPITVSGCLRSGELADNSWVLITKPSTANGATTPAATYQLIGGDAAALRDNVGRQVDVSGTVQAEQKVASSGEAVEHRAKGTTGTPTVETKTDVDIKRLSVATVTPTGTRCQ
jgi:hypothetical protein